jgi:O-succinylbenzoic acid--CoA ligase
MNGLHLNGTYYTAEELYKEATIKLSSLLPVWQKELYGFLKDWFDPSLTHIEVVTSGSTGIAKHLLVKKKQMENSAVMTNTFLGLHKHHTALLCLPVKYIGGKMMLVRASVGNYAIQAQEPGILPLSEDVESNFDFCAMTPMQAAHCLRSAMQKFRRIDHVIIGGGEIASPLMHQLQQLPNRVYQTFGMTETVSHIALRQLAPTCERYYRTLPGVTISTDERNCLRIMAPAVCEQSIQTNDLIQLVSNELFEWKGRWDDVINSGGLKINPAEMEKQLAGFIGRRFIVSYKPHEILGQELLLVVEGKAFSAQKEKALLDQIKSSLASSIVPKSITYRTDFPETPTGKINRKALHLQLQNKFNSHSTK